MSASLSTDAKRATIPVASALLIASTLALNAAQEPDFSKLTLPSRGTNPVPEHVEKNSPKLNTTAATGLDPKLQTNETAPTSEKHRRGPHIDPEDKSFLGKAAGIVSLVAAGFFARQTFKNGTTSKLGWVVTTANEGLMAITSLALGTMNNFWLPAAFVLGSGTTMAFALKFGKKEPLSTLEKVSGGVAAAGWLLFLARDPFWAAIAGQIGYHASNLAFMALFYKKPGEITIPGQALYLASAALNLFAVKQFLPLSDDLISPIGIGIGILLSSAALGLGHLREWRERRKTVAQNS